VGDVRLQWHDVETEVSALRAMSGWIVRITDSHGRSFDASIQNARVAATEGCELDYLPFGDARGQEDAVAPRAISTDFIDLLEIY
jgi:hypothetical protein